MDPRLVKRLKKFYGDQFAGFAPIPHIDNSLHVSVDHGYVYCDIPKAGCTTIKKTLIESVEGQEVDYNVHDRTRNPLQRPSAVLNDIRDLEKYFKFTFVRNPYTRTLSAYLDKILGNRPEKRSIVKALGMAIDDYKDIDISFKRFLETLASMEGRRMNEHFRPQALQSCCSVISYDYIGKFENFEADLISLLQKLGRRDASAGMIKSVVHHKTNASVLFEQFYDLETRKLVKKIYAEDFALFGY